MTKACFWTICLLSVLLVPDGAHADRAAAQDGGVLTVGDVINMESAGEFQISPDGGRVVWVKKVPNKSKNKHDRHIYLTSATGGHTLQLTRGEVDDRSPKFSPDGERVAYLSARGKKSKQQIYLLDLNGGEARKITSVAAGVHAFEWLDDRRVVYAAHEDSTLRQRRLAKDKDDVIVVADQAHYGPVRLFEFDVDSKKTTRLTTNSGVISEFSVSPDGRWVATSENQSVDYQYDRRVPPQQFLVDLQNGTRKQIFEQTYVNPYGFQWAADGEGFFCKRKVASDSVDAYVGITNLYYYDVAENLLSPVETGWDNGLGRSFFVVENGVVAALADGTADRIVHIVAKRGAPGEYDVLDLQTEKPVRLAAAARGGNRVVYTTSDASSIPDVMTATIDRDQLENRRVLFDLNESLRDKILARSEVIRWAGADGDTVEGVLYYPVDYDTAYSYPLVAVIHGGPSGVDPDFFTERWSNYPHVLAMKGTFVLKVNYHGSGNYGLRWLESIKGRYYELEVPDILNGIDHLIAQGNVDEEALGIMGWSNGSILAIACCIESDRFKAMCAGAGDVNWTSDYGNCAFGAAFDNAYLGGPPWENPQAYVDKSPLFRMQQLKTPTLIMFGAEDTSVPTEQGWQHFRAMQQIGEAPVRFIVFPGTGHGLRKLSHQKRKMEEELVWFDRYLFDSYQEKNDAFDEQSPLARALQMAQVEKIGYLIGKEIDATIVPEIVELEGIRVSRFEITRAQFSAFDPHYSYDPGTDNHPVNDISLPLAQTYCLWLSEKAGGRYRLPTEDEMDSLLAAARPNLPFENNLDYWLGYSPTPEELEMIQAKVDELEKTRMLIEPVGSFRSVAAANGAGVYDLGGNVSEWVVGDNGHGMIKGLSAVSTRDDRQKYSRPPLSYVGFRVVEAQ